MYVLGARPVLQGFEDGVKVLKGSVTRGEKGGG